MDFASRLVLHPEATCSSLRDDFGLQHVSMPNDPLAAGLPYEEHWAPTFTGQSVHLWYVPADKPLGTVIVSPGAWGCLPCYLFTTRLLADSGWTVVIYEYEGFGESSGTPSLLSLRSDLEAVLDWTRARTGESRVTLLGLSVGTIPTIAVAVERPDAVNGVVLDSPVAARLELERFRFVLGRYTDPLQNAFNNWLSSEKIIGRLSQPLLVFMHEWDVLTPPETVRPLFDRAPGEKRLVVFPQRMHACGQYLDTDVYRTCLDTFLSRVWTN